MAMAAKFLKWLFGAGRYAAALVRPDGIDVCYTKGTAQAVSFWLMRNDL
jgi:hypothetical protein